MTESERDREYRRYQAISRGESVVGDLAPDIERKGAVAEVEEEREAWAEEREQRRRRHGEA